MKNTHAEEVNIEVSEQVPLSTDDRIKVLCVYTDCDMVEVHVVSRTYYNVSGNYPPIVCGPGSLRCS